MSEIDIYDNVAYYSTRAPTSPQNHDTQETSGRLALSGNKTARCVIACSVILLAVYAVLCTIAITIAFEEISKLNSEITSVLC